MPEALAKHLGHKVPVPQPPAYGQFAPQKPGEGVYGQPDLPRLRFAPLPRRPGQTVGWICLDLPFLPFIEGISNSTRYFRGHKGPRELWQGLERVSSCSRANTWYHNPLRSRCHHRCRRTRGCCVGFGVPGMRLGQHKSFDQRPKHI